MSIINAPLLPQLSSRDLTAGLRQRALAEAIAIASCLDEEIPRFNTSKSVVQVSNFAGDETEVLFEVLTSECHAYFIVHNDGSHEWGATRNGEIIETGKEFVHQRDVYRVLSLVLTRKP